MTYVFDSLLTDSAMTANRTSAAQQLKFHALASIQAVYTGAPVGSLQLQASNDGVTWTNYLTPTAVSAAGSAIWPISEAPMPYLRVVYTFTSGTGTLNITAFCKGA